VTTFAHNIRIDRPHDDYRLDLQVSKIVLNTDLPADRFKLEQPPGSELVNVERSSQGEGNKQQ
jgi:outer membrane lipoprotein-sorting protein